jgi:hypothetical protein
MIFAAWLTELCHEPTVNDVAATGSYSVRIQPVDATH